MGFNQSVNVCRLSAADAAASVRCQNGAITNSEKDNTLVIGIIKMVVK